MRQVKGKQGRTPIRRKSWHPGWAGKTAPGWPLHPGAQGRGLQEQCLWGKSAPCKQPCDLEAGWCPNQGSNPNPLQWRLPQGLSSKESICNAGDAGSIPGSGRSPGGGNGNPLQYSCLGNLVDRGTWWATVHTVTKEVGYYWAYTLQLQIGILYLIVENS